MATKNTLIKKMESGEARTEEYEALLARCGRLCQEAGAYMLAYRAEFGGLIAANDKLRMECIRKKKFISYCRRRINRGLPIDTDRMQTEIDREMTLYHKKLQDPMENKNTEDPEAEGPDIEERIARVKRRINDILTTEPYTYGEILKNPEKRLARKEELQAEHDDYEKCLNYLTKTLMETLREGGANVL